MICGVDGVGVGKGVGVDEDDEEDAVKKDGGRVWLMEIPAAPLEALEVLEERAMAGPGRVCCRAAMVAIEARR